MLQSCQASRLLSNWSKELGTHDHESNLSQDLSLPVNGCHYSSQHETQGRDSKAEWVNKIVSNTVQSCLLDLNRPCWSNILDKHFTKANKQQPICPLLAGSNSSHRVVVSSNSPDMSTPIHQLTACLTVCNASHNGIVPSNSPAMPNADSQNPPP